MKKIFSLMLLCAAVLLNPGCKDDKDDNGGALVVALDQPTASVAIGGTITLVATVTPDNAPDKSVVWSSLNKSVATVVNGVVTGVTTGSTVITAKPLAGGKEATCTVTVVDEAVAVTGVTLDRSTASVSAGKTVTLIPTIAPAGATNKSVTWESSAPTVATVVGGVVTGVAVGDATITVTTAEGAFKATCVVTVTESASTVGFKTGDYHFQVAISETEAYWNQILITADNVPNQYIVEGLFDFTGLPFIAVYDADAMTLTLDGVLKGNEAEGTLWMAGFAYANEEKTQMYGIASGEEADEFAGDCVISVGADGAPTTFTTWLGLFIAEKATGKILGVPEQILEGTPITPGAAPEASQAMAPRKGVKRLVDKNVRLSSVAAHF